MAKQDIIVIGASSGGVEALHTIVSQLPADLPAALFAVLHLARRSKSYLPQILNRAGRFPAVEAQDGMPIEHGKLYLAVPDYHLVLNRGHVHLSSGPEEQHQRPCINVTFRSAAQAYGERVAGAILTGALDDGVAGLWEVKRHGGVAIVQNPEEAAVPSMPLSALREIEADYVVGLGDMGSLFSRLASQDGHRKLTAAMEAEMEGELTDLTCPDCRGTIWEVPRGNGREYRCRVGHTYSAKSMLAEHSKTQENALYSAVVALEEGASLANRLAEHFSPEIAGRLREEARERTAQAKAIREILLKRREFRIE
jgi:two-component system chemotaxis response regulator CheB